MYVAGRNDYNQLGVTENQDNVEHFEFTEENVKDASTGQYHSMMLKTDGTLYASGFNKYGQCGLSKALNSGKENIEGWTKCASNVAEVDCGANHTMFIDKQGRLFAAGHNFYGQLGSEFNNNNNTGQDYFTFTGITNAVKVTCGTSHTVVLLENGDIVGFGYNEYNQLTGPAQKVQPTPEVIFSNCKAVACGARHTLAITITDEIYGVGDTEFKQILTNVTNLEEFALMSNIGVF